MANDWQWAMSEAEKQDFPYGGTPAARMLTNALHRASHEYGVSLREAGRQLGYKQAVVLSHMATGRVPIPVDRAMEIASVLKLHGPQFLGAVLRQRHPDVPWDDLLAVDGAMSGSGASFLRAIEKAAGKRIEDIPSRHRSIMLEVAAADEPDARWLTVPEGEVIERLRRARPDLPWAGLDSIDANFIDWFLKVPKP